MMKIPHELHEPHGSICVAKMWKEPVNDVETYPMIVARFVCSDIWCCGLVMLFCQNPEWNWNLLPRHCDEHCIDHLKNFWQRPISTSICVFFDQLSLHVRPENKAPNSLYGNKCHVDIDIRGFPDPMVAVDYWIYLQASANIYKCCPPTWLPLFQEASNSLPAVKLQVY